MTTGSAVPGAGVSVVLETESSRDARGIGVTESLGSLAGQDYPRDRTEVIVLDSGEARLVEAVRRLLPAARIVDGAALTKYQMKNRGAEAATCAIVAFLDGDCQVGSGWVSEVARTLAAAPSDVVGVQGRTVLAPGPFHRQVTALLYGLRTDRSGRLALRIVSDNCAFRREFIRRVPFPQAHLLTTPESMVMARMRRAGLRMLANDAMHAVHDYSLGLRLFLSRGYATGFCMLMARRTGRDLPAWWAARLWLAGPPLVTAGKWLTDLNLIVTNQRALGLRWAQWVPFLPVYLLYYAGHLAGGYAAACRRAVQADPPAARSVR